MATESASTSETEQFWRKVLIEGHRPLRVMHTLFRYLPSPPRCKVCHNPFGGLGGKLVGLFGFHQSRKNPNLCTACCERIPAGGAEVDIAVLFVYLRCCTPWGLHFFPTARSSDLSSLTCPTRRNSLTA